jgi:hypothetical protein
MHARLNEVVFVVHVSMEPLAGVTPRLHERNQDIVLLWCSFD